MHVLNHNDEVAKGAWFLNF